MRDGLTVDEAFEKYVSAISPAESILSELSRCLELVARTVVFAFPVRTEPPAPSPIKGDKAGAPYVAFRIDDAPTVPLELIAIGLMGSAVRNTVVDIGRKVDMDLVVLFQGDVPYDVFKSYSPEALVNRVAEVLNTLDRPLTTWSGQAVTVHFDHGCVDVFPAFRLWDSEGWYFPHQQTQWFRSRPTVLDQMFAMADQALHGAIATRARLLKAWSAYSGFPLKSFHLETVVLRDIQRRGSLGTLSEYLANFFGAAQIPSFLAVPSCDSLYLDLSRIYTSVERASIRATLRTAASISASARRHEVAGRVAEANLTWRELLGPAFPRDESVLPRAAEDPNLSCLVGVTYLGEDNKAAEHYLRQAAVQGHPGALFTLSQLLFERNDIDEGEILLAQAADAGHGEAAIRLASIVDARGDDGAAESRYRQAAAHGSIGAVLELGRRAEHRHDLLAARALYEEAASRGSTEAMMNLAALNNEALHYVEARGWWRKAAERGEVPAMKQLAAAFESVGEREEAGRWWEMAADAGDFDAGIRLGMLYEKVGRKIEASERFRTAAQQGSDVARQRWLALGGSQHGMAIRPNGEVFDPVIEAASRLIKRLQDNPDELARVAPHLSDEGKWIVLASDPPQLAATIEELKTRPFAAETNHIVWLAGNTS